MIEGENQYVSEKEQNEPTLEELIAALSEIQDLDPESLEDLRGMEFEDALGAAYGLLLELGVDPNEKLKEIGILE